MKAANFILAVTLSSAVLSSSGVAQPLSGTIVKIDRLKGTVAIRPIQNGTTGANTGGAAEEFKAQGGLSLDAVHAGDRVTFSVAENGGVKTITKIDKQ
jgi:Copper binding periplasmic protein CusF